MRSIIILGFIAHLGGLALLTYIAPMVPGFWLPLIGLYIISIYMHVSEPWFKGMIHRAAKRCGYLVLEDYASQYLFYDDDAIE